MALSRAERNAVLKRIGDFMQGEFSPVLSHYYARCVAYSGKHPQNINNEIRNAITHMSRALSAGDNTEAQNELTSAERHVERFKRDCLKVAVIYAGKDAAKMIRHVEVARGKLDPRLHVECAAIVAERYRILTLEVLGDKGSATRWEALLLKIEKLRAELISTYTFLDPKGFKVGWLISTLWRWFARVSGFIIVTILAAAITAAAIPDDQKFGENAQRLIVQVTGTLFGVPSVP